MTSQGRRHLPLRKNTMTYTGCVYRGTRLSLGASGEVQSPGYPSGSPALHIPQYSEHAPFVCLPWCLVPVECHTLLHSEDSGVQGLGHPLMGPEV